MNGLTPPVAEKVDIPFVAKFKVFGEIAKAGFTVTTASAVLLRASVTRTVTLPETAGAVNNPEDESILPPPLTRE